MSPINSRIHNLLAKGKGRGKNLGMFPEDKKCIIESNNETENRGIYLQECLGWRGCGGGGGCFWLQAFLLYIGREGKAQAVV